MCSRTRSHLLSEHKEAIAVGRRSQGERSSGGFVAVPNRCFFGREQSSLASRALGDGDGDD